MLILILISASAAWGRPTTPAQAESVVRCWLSLEGKPLGSPLGQEIAEVQSFRDDAGNPLYHVVYLKPKGLVFVAGDDLVEPIIVFLPRGYYDPSPKTCLGALVGRDIPGRVRWVREREAQARTLGRAFAPEGLLLEALRKWQALETGNIEAYMSQVSDERIPPLVKSKWNQGNEGANWCYNYYTPMHRVCGCAATALAQVMRYHKHPTAGIGVHGFWIFVDGVKQWAKTRGGDGSGGPYGWANMVLDPDGNSTDVQRRAIGALTYDAGVTVNMHYDPGGSSAILGKKYPLVQIFQYGNTYWGWKPGGTIPTANRDAMINPNLDAGLPVIFGVNGPQGYHFPVADGYGYHLTTLYHHLNLGWSGSSDAWYNLPNIDSSPPFNTVEECWYNIYKSGTGEIISGRVLTPEGFPISGATVKATGGGQTLQTQTNGRGIYAFTRLPASTTFTIETWGLSTTQSISVTTGKSQNGTTTTGNLWEQNLMLASANTRLNAIWVHGTQIMPENPSALANTARRGWGIYFWGKENTANWFHIPIPTPVIKEDRRTVLVDVCFFFKTLGNAKITNVHVWDGNTKIRAYDGLSLTGNHLAWDRWNVFSLWKTMSTGVEVAVRVEFGAKSGGEYAGVHFSSAGADFYRWW